MSEFALAAGKERDTAADRASERDTVGEMVRTETICYVRPEDPPDRAAHRTQH